MNDLAQIKVICHSGFKADEYPKYFYWDNIRLEIKEIQDRWYQGDKIPPFPQATYFKVITTDGKTWLLKHEIKNDKWYLLIHGESLNL
ncbi:MAG: cytoplasmic protein [Bacteroidota bacterium]